MSAGNNVVSETTIRKLKQYEHTYMVQDATDKEIFRSFPSAHEDIKIGFLTFRKLKPFHVRQCQPADIETCCGRKHVNFRNAD